MKIGDIVQYNTGDSCEPADLLDKPALGRIVTKETLEDDNGRRIWWNVRWFDECRRPQGGEIRYSAAELIVFAREEKGA